MQEFRVGSINEWPLLAHLRPEANGAAQVWTHVRSMLSRLRVHIRSQTKQEV
jgi:hypothetical protein